LQFIACRILLSGHRKLLQNKKSKKKGEIDNINPFKGSYAQFRGLFAPSNTISR
jgi:hypothetical protein